MLYYIKSVLQDKEKDIECANYGELLKVTLRQHHIRHIIQIYADGWKTKDFLNAEREIYEDGETTEIIFPNLFSKAFVIVFRRYDVWDAWDEVDESIEEGSAEYLFDYCSDISDFEEYKTLLVNNLCMTRVVENISNG